MSGKDHELDLLEARISALERQVQFLLKINGLDFSELRSATDQDLLKLYQDAVHLLGLPVLKVPEEVIERWGNLFLQLSEIEFTRLQTLVDYDHTWEPFYELCLRLQTRLRHTKGFEVDPIARQLYALLDRGRKSLQAIAVIMMRHDPKILHHRAKVLLQPDIPPFTMSDLPRGSKKEDR